LNQILQIVGHAWTSVALPVHLAVASWVTVHALLHKRDVGSALGWIGLAWLSPFFGGFFYFVLGINRVRRRAHRLRVPRPARTKAADIATARVEDHLAPLEAGLGRITGRSTKPGNGFAIFQNGDAAYPAMLDAIADAKASVALSSFIFHTDPTGSRFIAALSAAQRRGVAVRVIIDGVGGGWVLSSAYHKLRRAGVPAGRFMHSPLPWRMPLLNLRSHKKILVVDGRIGFTGGMNIADENVMALKPKAPVQDTHFKVVGPVVGQLMSAFASDWAFVSGEDLQGDAWFPTVEPAGDAIARVVTSGPDRDVEKMEFAALQAIACARKSIHIMTPYFLPDDHLLLALAMAAVRGIAVDVVIPNQSNHRLVDWATRGTIEPMMRDGVRVWLGPSPFRHSKVMVIDGEWSLIGSANWDMRSFRLNFELCMEVYDRPLAEALRRFVTAHQGERLTLEAIAARSLPVRLRDAAVRLLMPYL
jgi:cardiolipin synthase